VVNKETKTKDKGGLEAIMSLTLGQALTMSANKFPAKEAIIFNKENKRLTYKMLDERANKLANTLIGLGLKKGDRCAILFYNRCEWAEVYFGLARAGIIAVPVNFRLTAPEIEYILGNSQPKALIYEEEFSATIAQVGKNVKIEHYLCLGKGDALDYDDCIAKAAANAPDVFVEETDPIFISYTSGTTGLPKGAVITHRNLILHLLFFFKEHGNLGRDDNLLLIMPIFHSNSTWWLTGAIMFGGTLVAHPSGGFKAEEVLQVIDKEKISFTCVVPTMLALMVNLPEEEKSKYDVSSMKRFLVGSAPLSTNLKGETLKFFTQAELYEGYGSTETGCVTVLSPEDQLKKPRSIGPACTGKEIRLLDDSGKEVQQGQIGELYTKGWGVLVTEYWNDPEASKNAFRDGWCTVGDMARSDEEGYFFLEDRKKDMIISGGENIYPTEIENVLMTHPAVMEVAVIGLSDDVWGEKVKAVVALKEGQQATDKELMDFCKDKLAGYKRPRSVDFLKELPKSATGKILRRKVRDLYQG
jgi:long-chain acyl-CoA synthetase